MAETKTVAERLREITYDHVDCPADVATLAIGSGTIDCAKPCPDCTRKYLDKLADTIEAEQAQAVSKALIEEAAKQENMDSVLLYNAAKDLQENAHIIKESVLEDLAHCAGLIRKVLKGAKPQLPEGVIWPTYEDGELVKFGDEIDVGGFTETVTLVGFDKTYVRIEAETDDYTSFFELEYGEPVKRPEPEVLDADGVPIKVGDTVYHEVDGSELIVVGFRDEKEDGEVMVDVEGKWFCVRQFSLTHRKPDTQEAIDADCWVDAKDYCEKYDVKTEWPKHYGKAKCEHLLARQRKLTQGTDPFVSWAKTAYTCNECGADNTPTYRVRTSGGE